MRPGGAPGGVFQIADGFLSLVAFNDRDFRALCGALGLAALADDPRFATAPARAKNRDACDALIVALFAERTSEDVVQRLEGAGIPCGIVRSLGEALELERESGTGSVAEVDYGGEAGVIPGVRIPVKFDGEWCPAAPAPALGQDNAMLARFRKAPK